ncbi:hypothetical protein ACFX1Q_007240 [Malus domestica]
MASAIPKATSLIADRIAQRRSSSMPSVPKFVPKRLFGAKYGLPLERLTAMKSDKTNSSVKNKETASASSHEKFTKSIYGEIADICALLKLDMLEDMDVCAKFIDGVKGVVGPSSFAKHTTWYRMTALLAMM